MKGKDVELWDRVIEAGCQNYSVFITSVNHNKHKTTLKKHEIVERVNTILTMDEEGVESLEEWCKEKLKSDIKLGTNLNEMQTDRVYGYVIGV